MRRRDSDLMVALLRDELENSQSIIKTLLDQNQRLTAALIAPSNPVGASVVARRERPERPPVIIPEGL